MTQPGGDGGDQPTGTEHTYRVVRLVCTSDVSWEDAARRGVAEAAKTVRSLRYAKVVDLDATVSDDGVRSYRLKLELAHQLDRLRPDPDGGRREITVRRYLVVANETLDTDLLRRAVEARMALGAAEFHVLVPATRSAETRRLTTMTADPLSGYATGDLIGLEAAVERDRQAAVARLHRFSAQLEAMGADFTSEIGSPDPFGAIGAVLERSSFDEIVISTLPSTVSRWLRIDLPSRVRRAWPITVATMIADPV
ncbi:MAG: dodecin family protein [Acidimicrobiales bacterium]